MEAEADGRRGVWPWCCCAPRAREDARQLLGGDAIVNSDLPTPAAFGAKAQALGLASSTSVSFPTMARAPDEAGGASKLVAFKAVTSGYPLRGNVRVGLQFNADQRLELAP